MQHSKPTPFPSLFAAGLLTCVFGCSGESAETFRNTGEELSREVGKACVHPDEDNPAFPGFGRDEIVVGENSCELGICVSYYFQGRVSCPDGQEAEGECMTPSGEPVTAPVPPQLADRPAEDNVFCSCRCDGPSGAGPFCDCPDGYSCEPLLADLGDDDISGSYCLPVDTQKH